MRKTILLIIVSVIFSRVYSQADPEIGAIKTMQVRVFRLNVSASGTSKMYNAYNPPTGWQILAIEPVVISNSKGMSYHFSKVATNYQYSSTSVIYSKFIELLELAGERNALQKFEAAINQMRNDFDKYSSGVVPTYSTITTTASVANPTAYGKKRAARLYLDLKITLVYVPPNQEQVLKALEDVKHMIDAEE